MSMNLHLKFIDKKFRPVHEISLYQTPTKITKEFLNEKLDDVFIDKKNFKDLFFKKYIEFLNKYYGLKSVEEFNKRWWKERTEYINSFEDLNMLEIVSNSRYYKYYMRNNPPEPHKVFNKIFDIEAYDHIRLIISEFNSYIDDYRCIMYAM